MARSFSSRDVPATLLRRIQAALGFAVGLGLLTLAGCGQSPETAGAPEEGIRAATPADPLVVLGAAPVVGGPAGYVGASSCRECHTNEFTSWHASFHRTMTQPATASTVVADFQGVVLEAGGERFTLSRNGDEHWVAIEDLEELAAVPAGQAPPPPVRVRLALVTGAHHMQVFWLPAGYGNAQVGFPFTWLVEERRWAPRQAVFIRDPQAPAPVETWNMTCIRCHVTAGQPRPRPEQERFETRLGDFGISCEACHGPGERHVAAMRELVEVRRRRPATPNPPEMFIVQPEDLDHGRRSQVCGQCHGMKWFDRHEGWAEEGFRYRPGDDLEATTPIIRPAHLADQPWLGEAIRRHPTLLEEFFWSDGMIRVAGREYNGLLETACHQRGELSCLSCHAMHDYRAPADQLRRVGESDAACLQCHAPATYQSEGHTHHRPGSAGSLCYNCHMPHTTYGLLKGIRQHQIDSPRVDVTVATGRPNACNLCHLDRPLAWSGRYLREWYGQPATEPVPAEAGSGSADLSAAVEWLLTGDAGQRALLAWHFGWEPAREASGGDWQAGFLARLLDDPYPAVRYIAHQSLRRQAGFGDFAYDFVGDPAGRRAAMERAWNRARTGPVRDEARRKALVQTVEGGPDRAAMEALQARRNERPVHLRE